MIAEPQEFKSRYGHYAALYIERHNRELFSAECSCGWKTGWVSHEDRAKMLAEHLPVQHISQQDRLAEGIRDMTEAPPVAYPDFAVDDTELGSAKEAIDKMPRLPDARLVSLPEEK